MPLPVIIFYVFNFDQQNTYTIQKSPRKGRPPVEARDEVKGTRIFERIPNMSVISSDGAKALKAVARQDFRSKQFKYTEVSHKRQQLQ